MSGGPPPVHTAGALFQRICYENKDALSAGIIVAGWDKEVGPSVYNIPLGGGLFRQPWAIGGIFRPFFQDHRCLTLRYYRIWLDVCVRLLRCYLQRWMGQR
jgi:20S proteasome alpha/beta subunit